MLMKFINVVKEEASSVETKTGGYNDAPPNFREITEKEFAESIFFVYTPIYSEDRQIMPDRYKDCRVSKKDGQMLSVHLYHMQDGTGFGIGHDYWSGKVIFYAFGCEHQFVELSQAECKARGIYHAGRCWHVHECKKCNYVEGVDSSD